MGREMHNAFRLLGMLLAMTATASVADSASVIMDWSSRTVLTLTESGKVTVVNVVPGQQVEKDAVLLELDQRGYRAALAAARVELQATHLDLEEAEREKGRLQELYDLTLLSDHDLQQGIIAYEHARAKQLSAQHRLVMLTKQQGQSVLKAPFAGRVAAVYKRPGQNAINRLQAEPLVELVDNSRLEAGLLLEPHQARALILGQKLAAGVNGQRVEAMVESITLLPAVDAKSGPMHRVVVTVPVSAEIDAGMALEVDLP